MLESGLAHEQLRQLISPEQIALRVRELAVEISHDMTEPLLVLGVLKGAFIFMADLVRQIEIPLEMDFISLSSYGSEASSSGQIELQLVPHRSLADRNILVVEDIVDTGLCLSWLKKWLTPQEARQIKLCTLIDKPQHRQTDIKVDYVGFVIPSGFLVGYGLDYAQRYRELPGIYELGI